MHFANINREKTDPDLAALVIRRAKTVEISEKLLPAAEVLFIVIIAGTGSGERQSEHSAQKGRLPLLLAKDCRTQSL